MKQIKDSIKRRMADSKGFTLVEAMISLAVFSIGILGMIVMQTTAMKSNSLAESVSENTVLAVSEIEELMAADYLDKRIKEDDVTYSEQKDSGKYTLTAKSLTDDAIPGAKRVTVTSTFKGTSNSRDQIITLKIFKPYVME